MGQAFGLPLEFIFVLLAQTPRKKLCLLLEEVL